MAAPINFPRDKKILKNIQKDFQQSINKPENFLVDQEKIAKHLKSSTKHLYDFIKQREIKSSGNALDELIIDGFDDEQVWQEIELQNGGAVDNLVKGVSQLLASKDRLGLLDEDEENVSEDENYDDDSEVSDLEKWAELKLDESDSEIELNLIKNRTQLDLINDEKDSDDSLDFDMDEIEDGDDYEEDDTAVDEDENENIPSSFSDKKKPKNLRKTEVDDKFFSLAEMEEFLEREDAKALGKSFPEEKDEEEIDLFASDEEYMDDEDEDKEIKYEDFFDPPTDQSIPSKEKKVTFEGEGEESSEDEELMESDGDDENGEIPKRNILESESDEGEDVDDILGHKKESKSNFEKRQERLKNKISQLEESAISEKPWQLMGESVAGTRPENSLLQDDLQFDHTSRLAPEITEETTKELEDIIKQRIKDKAWDDVERKIRKEENPFEYKKRITLDQEKSKLSLGEVYEKEYLKQIEEEKEDEVDQDHESIKKMLESLFIKLDALSNFHYTPKMVSADIKIVSNQPSIAMEEVAPVTVSDAKILAPEEIKDKSKAPVLGATERTAEDKKRARRQKKADKRKRRKEKEKRQKIVEKLNPGLGNKYTKEKALKDIDKLSKGKDVTVIKGKDGSKNIKSSKQFFTQLQDEVSSHIKSKKTVPIEKKQSSKSSSKLKL